VLATLPIDEVFAHLNHQMLLGKMLVLGSRLALEQGCGEG